MKTEQNYQRQVGLITALSGILALGSMVVGLFAVEFDFNVFSKPAEIIQRFPHLRLYAKWSMLLDLLGYYLLLLPAIFYLHTTLEAKTPWAKLLTFCALAYVLIGSIGAAILTAEWPRLMQQYLVAGPDQRVLVQSAFEQVTGIVYEGMWNQLEMGLSGLWWLGVGLALRPAFKALGNTTVVLGVSCLIDCVGNWMDIKPVAEIGLNIYLLLAIVWPVWLGIMIYRNCEQFLLNRN